MPPAVIATEPLRSVSYTVSPFMGTCASDRERMQAENAWLRKLLEDKYEVEPIKGFDLLDGRQFLMLRHNTERMLNDVDLLAKQYKQAIGKLGMIGIITERKLDPEDPNSVRLINNVMGELVGITQELVNHVRLYRMCGNLEQSKDEGEDTRDELKQL
jgi:hypothetical protein